MNLTYKLPSPSRNRQVLKHDKKFVFAKQTDLRKSAAQQLLFAFIFLMIFSTVTEKFKLLLHYGKVLLLNFPLKLELPCSV